MGCDIHTHIEYKYPGDTHYEWFASPNVGGSYVLFALLAGVRVNWVERHHGITVNAVFAPRGIPEFTSHITDSGYRYWVCDTGQWEVDNEFHSHSWLNTEEIKVVAEKHVELYKSSFDDYKMKNGVDWDVELKATIAAMEVLPEARLVFWFDN